MTYTATEVAAKTGVPIGTLRSHIKRGHLTPSVLVGNRWQFTDSDISAYLASERKPGRPRKIVESEQTDPSENEASEHLSISELLRRHPELSQRATYPVTPYAVRRAIECGQIVPTGRRGTVPAFTIADLQAWQNGPHEP